MGYILRSHYKNIFFEFQPNSNKNICIILLDWLPSSSPSKKEVMIELEKYWYATIAPRYKWTRESRWLFLEESPSKDIQELLEFSKQWLLYDYYNKQEYDISMMKFIIIWVSFWWAVALDLIQTIDEEFFTILISPLTWFKNHNTKWNEQNLYSLGNFIKNWFWNAYRFNEIKREELCSWDLFDTQIDKIKEINNNIAIIHSDNDDSISIDSIKEFSSQTQIKNLTILKSRWHLSYSKWDKKIYDIINQIILDSHTISIWSIIYKKNDIWNIDLFCVKDINWDRWFPKWLSENNEDRENTIKREIYEEINISDIKFIQWIQPFISNYSVYFWNKKQYKTSIYIPATIKWVIKLDNIEIIDSKRININQILTYINYKWLDQYITILKEKLNLS